MISIPLGKKLGSIKFTSWFCRTVKMTKIMGAWTSYLCPCLQEDTETKIHVLKCKHPYMIDAFEKETKSLKTTLKKIDTEPPLLKALTKYVRGKGQTSIESYINIIALQSELRNQDIIGWRKFMEGKVEISVINLQDNHYKQIGSTRSTIIWARKGYYKRGILD